MRTFFTYFGPSSRNGTTGRIAAALGFLLALVTLARPAAAQGGPLPTGLREHFVFGLAAQPTDGQTGTNVDNIHWLKNSGTPWDVCYQYLAGGVNTGNGWAHRLSWPPPGTMRRLPPHTGRVVRPP